MNGIHTQAAKSRIDAHLDAVERELQAAGTERSKRRGIVDDLETQILDMLAAKAVDAPTLADVDDILRRLDPPEAYSGQTPPAEPALRPAVPAARSPVAFCPEASQAARWMGVGILGLASLGFEMSISSSIREGHLLAANAVPSGWAIALFVAVSVASSVAAIAGPVVGTTLGWIATKRIRTSEGAEYGLPYSVIAALCCPAIAIWIGTLAISEWGMISLYRRNRIRIVDHEYWTILHAQWIFSASVLSIALVAALMRFSSARTNATRSFRLRSPLVAVAR
jgi:hypothetical protein